MNNLQNNLAELRVAALFSGNKPVTAQTLVLSSAPQTTELLDNCPFCGGTPEIWKQEAYVVVRCSGCWATHKVAFFDMSDLTNTSRDLTPLINGVIAKWNRRTASQE